MNNRVEAIVWAILGIITFLIFSYDIENDRDFSTWLWLLNSQMYFIWSLRCWIKHDRENNSVK